MSRLTSILKWFLDLLRIKILNLLLSLFQVPTLYEHPKGSEPIIRHNYCTDDDVDSRLSVHCRGTKKYTSYRESAKSSAAAVAYSPRRRRRAMYVVRSAYWIRFLQGAGDIAVALQSELRNHVALFGKSACKCASEVRGAAIARDPVAWDVGSLFFEPFFPSSQNLEKKRIRRRFVC